MEKAKRKKEHYDDLFDVKVSIITDKKMEEDLLYHIRTNNCPYNKLECTPKNCIYSNDGMSKCPIHQGEVP